MNQVSKSPRPFFSVIVCAYNEEKLLHACLESLLKQNYPREQYEIWIIDDESTDKTADIAENQVAQQQGSFPRMHYAKIKHGGLAVARNTGIGLAQGEVLAFIDGDAMAHPDWLKHLEKPFKTQNADYAGGKIELLNSESPIARVAQEIRHKQYFGPELYLNHFIGCNMAIRKRVFQSAGGFFENFYSRGDEVSLNFKIKDRFRYQPAPEAVVYHERPDKLWDWIKTEWKSATLWGLTKKVLPARKGWRPHARNLERLLVVLFPPALFLPVLHPLWTVLLFVSTAAFYRHLFVYPENRRILDDVSKLWGRPRGILMYSLYIWVKYANVLFGKALGNWKYRNTALIPPGTCKPDIIAMKSSSPQVA